MVAQGARKAIPPSVFAVIGTPRSWSSCSRTPSSPRGQGAKNRSFVLSMLLSRFARRAGRRDTRAHLFSLVTHHSSPSYELLQRLRHVCYQEDPHRRQSSAVRLRLLPDHSLP